MKTKWIAWAGRWLGLATALAMLGSCAHQDPAQAAIESAERAMGSASLRNIQYSATGTGWGFGQAFRPGMPWPRANVVSYQRVIDVANGAYREEQVRARAEPTGGTALPLAGETRSVALWRDGVAWNIINNNPVGAPRDALARAHDYWITPHAILKAARGQPATVVAEGGMQVVSFAQPGLFRARVAIAADGTVARVESVQSNPVLGDLTTVTEYQGYRDHGGVKFPSRIRQSMGGHPVLDLAVSQVQANAAADMPVPDAARAFRENVAGERAAPGVWYLAGGSHHSVLIEMADHLILVESPLYDGRALPGLAEARRLVPNKPVRYVINSHHHFDHSGGLRTAASEGATLVVHEAARAWWANVFANPNTIVPDALAKSGKAVTLMGVDGQRTFTDGTRTVQVHAIRDSVHSEGFLMVWLPAERLLIEADAYTPLPPNTPPPSPPNANNVNLVANIERLQLNPERILPLHGRMVPAGELYTTIGRPR